MKAGEREHRSDPWKFVEDGYRVIARRPRSELVDKSMDPERADEIEAITHGMMRTIITGELGAGLVAPLLGAPVGQHLH